MTHNPDNLTPEQIGTADGWRLLDEDEVKHIVNSIRRQGIEVWSRYSSAWTAGAWGENKLETFRTKLTRIELHNLRYPDAPMKNTFSDDGTKYYDSDGDEYPTETWVERKHGYEGSTIVRMQWTDGCDVRDYFWPQAKFWLIRKPLPPCPPVKTPEQLLAEQDEAFIVQETERIYSRPRTDNRDDIRDAMRSMLAYERSRVSKEKEAK